MSKSARYSNFRGGVITYVSGLTPSTVNTWGLALGNRQGEGHPRYSIVDVLAVELMKELTRVAKVAAPRATFVVGSVLPELPALIERVLAENATEGHWRWEGGPYLLIGGGYDSGPHQEVKPLVVEDSELAETIRNCEVASLILILLRRRINSVVFQLDSYLEKNQHQVPPTAEADA